MYPELHIKEDVLKAMIKDYIENDMKLKVKDVDIKTYPTYHLVVQLDFHYKEDKF